MYVIIVGCGKVGRSLAESLSDDGHDVVIVDSESDSLSQLESGFNGVIVQGVPLDEDVLMDAGIDRADALVAVTQDDNMNVTVSEIAKEIFNVPKVITRVYDPDREVAFQQMGLNTICPATLTAAHIKNMLNEKPDGIFNSFGGKNIVFRFIDPVDEYFGKYIKSIDPGANRTIFGIIKGVEFQFANPNVRIDQGDTLVIAEYV